MSDQPTKLSVKDLATRIGIPMGLPGMAPPIIRRPQQDTSSEQQQQPDQTVNQEDNQNNLHTTMKRRPTVTGNRAQRTFSTTMNDSGPINDANLKVTNQQLQQFDNSELESAREMIQNLQADLDTKTKEIQSLKTSNEQLISQYQSQSEQKQDQLDQLHQEQLQKQEERLTKQFQQQQQGELQKRLKEQEELLKNRFLQQESEFKRQLQLEKDLWAIQIQELERSQQKQLQQQNQLQQQELQQQKQLQQQEQAQRQEQIQQQQQLQQQWLEAYLSSPESYSHIQTKVEIALKPLKDECIAIRSQNTVDLKKKDVQIADLGSKLNKKETEIKHLSDILSQERVQWASNKANLENEVMQGKKSYQDLVVTINGRGGDGDASQLKLSNRDQNPDRDLCHSQESMKAIVNRMKDDQQSTLDRVTALRIGLQILLDEGLKLK